MFNSKLWLLIFFQIIILKSNLFCHEYNSKKFVYYYNRVKFNKEVAIKNIKFVESKASYDAYLSSGILELSYNCFKNNKKIYQQAYKKYKVSPYIINSILTIESLCGSYNSKYYIVEAYKTLITLKLNKKKRNHIFKILKTKHPNISKKWFLKRINKKYYWALNEIKALKKIFISHKINIFKIKGSWAGAFGYPQFIPSTFLHYAVDGNNDNKIDLFTFPDAIFSIANYLKKSGWQEKYSNQLKEKIIRKYNNSVLYSSTIIKLSQKIKKLTQAFQ